ncbi:MAG: hypothetical protein F9K19_10840 [Rhizobiaceae bacterium]|jgi:hypothetical protein|nr:MAG: hypothetical protein F9K19_10840 [Rhizobiaceae bacterium]CAG0973561.1 hypothetical protein RHIZO_01354 [Rhizobiaceae bacterium]
MRASWAGRIASAALLFLASPAVAQTCTAEVGAEEAKTYVDQCLEVSPATRPPCNADNACQLIWDEIARGCAMLGEDAPDFCSDYGE